MIERACRTHKVVLLNTDPPQCPKGHIAHTWHVVDTRTRTIIHEAGRRGEAKESPPPSPPRRNCPRCKAEVDVIRRYIDIRSNRKFPVCGVCGFMFKRNKYNAIRTVDITGKVRASRRESKRGNELFMLQQVGEIKNLRYCNDAPKNKYQLSVFSNPAVLKLLAALSGKPEFASLAQEVRESLTKITTYTPDFTYTNKGGFSITEDSKGFRTPEYRLKAKLFKAVTGQDILET